MTAPPTSLIHFQLNQLRRGSIYRATTPHGSTIGEYLGMESSHGDRAVLLRDLSGTASVPLHLVTAMRRVA